MHTCCSSTYSKPCHTSELPGSYKHAEERSKGHCFSSLPLLAAACSAQIHAKLST